MAIDGIAGPGGAVGPAAGAMDVAANVYAPPAPAAEKVAAFEAVLNQTAPPPADATPSSAPLPWETGLRGPNPTDAFLDRLTGGVDALREATMSQRAEAAAILRKEDVGPADLLRAQFALMESGALVTLAGKVTEKITTAVKTLQQGQ